MINELDTKKSIIVENLRETNRLTLEFHNESDLYQMLQLFREALVVLGFNMESINEAIEDQEDSGIL